MCIKCFQWFIQVTAWKHNAKECFINLWRFLLSYKEKIGLGAIRDAQNVPSVEKPMIVTRYSLKHSKILYILMQFKNGNHIIGLISQCAHKAVLFGSLNFWLYIVICNYYEREMWLLWNLFFYGDGKKSYVDLENHSWCLMLCLECTLY